MPFAEQLTGPDAEHGEGPVWSTGWGGLRWVDMMMGDVLHLRDTGQVTRWGVSSVVAMIRPRKSGGIVIAAEREILLADEVGGALKSLGELFDDPSVRFNEGGCDPVGNLLIGTMAYDERPGGGTIYRVGTDHRTSPEITGVTVSNGLAWSPSGDLAYYADSGVGRIDVFDSDSQGKLTGRRPFAVIESVDGVPDGLCVDSQGGIWVALFNGSAVRHYAADGILADVIDVPTRKVTACTFGGAKLDELFITTSRYGEDDLEGHLGGSIFSYRAGVTGLPVLAFGG